MFYVLWKALKKVQYNYRVCLDVAMLIIQKESLWQNSDYRTVCFIFYLLIYLFDATLQLRNIVNTFVKPYIIYRSLRNWCQICLILLPWKHMGLLLNKIVVFQALNVNFISILVFECLKPKIDTVIWNLSCELYRESHLIRQVGNH